MTLPTKPALSLPAAAMVSVALLASTPITAYPQDEAPEGLQHQVALVTGSTSGLGREVAYRLASTGVHVIVHGRDVERGGEVVARITEEGVGSARFIRADLASLTEVRELAETVLRDYDRLDLLVNNAGIGSRVPAERVVSEDGHELRFAVNYLSHFLLTHLLRSRLEASAPSRIVNVSSIGQAPIDFDDVMMENDYSGSRAYGQSKLAQIMFTIDLAERLEGTGVLTYALHPATYMDTGMVRAGGITPRTSVDEGADAVMQLVTGEGLESGQFFNGLQPGRANAQAYDADARERLWRLSAELTGVAATGGSAGAGGGSAGTGDADVAYLATPEQDSLDLPFSEAVRVGGMLYLSGQVGNLPGTLELVEGGIQAETRQTMENIGTVLARYGSSLDRVVKCTVMIDDMAEWPAMNEVYEEFFPDNKPARSAVGADGLALGAAVEIECWATVG